MPADNTEQLAYWNEQGGPRWAALQQQIDAMLEPLGREALDVLAPAPGEAALDVGCGCGQTTLELAARVGSRGCVWGLDPSAPMLARARERASSLAQVRFVEGDAQVFDFGDQRFDLIFSRFGVMFFADPVAAFANLRRALSDGGRLGFVCWQAPARNPWAGAPVEAVLRHVPAPPAPEPGAPGPFSFAERERIEKTLREAGFAEVQVESSVGDLWLGGTRTLDAAIEFALRVGPGSRLLLGQPEATAAAARASIGEALAPYVGEAGVRIPRATWVVRAA